MSAAKLNYDPNLFCSGNRAKQTIRLTFGMWQYAKVMEVDLYSNVSGLDAIRYGVEQIHESLPLIEYDPENPYARIVLDAENGDTLTCDDEENEGEDWLFKMVIGAEIIAVEPAGRIFDPVPTDKGLIDCGKCPTTSGCIGKCMKGGA